MLGTREWCIIDIIIDWSHSPRVVDSALERHFIKKISRTIFLSNFRI